MVGLGGGEAGPSKRGATSLSLLKGSLMSEAKQEVGVWPASSCGECMQCWECLVGDDVPMTDYVTTLPKTAGPFEPCGVCTGCDMGHPEYCTDKFVLPVASWDWDGKEVF